MIVNVVQRNAYIVHALRTPIARAKRGKKGGVFSNVHPTDLGATVVRELVARAKLEPDKIEDLIFGCATQTGKQGFNTARLIALKALGEKVPATTVNRLCGSGEEAVNIAASKILAGFNNLLIAGGVESMSQVPIGSDMLPFPGKLKNIWEILTQGKQAIRETLPPDYNFHWMIESGEKVALKYGITREEMDRFSFESHMKASHATQEGYFKNEIVPVGNVSIDDGIRKDTSVEKLGNLKPVSQNSDLITAGNSSQITDGAAALLLASDEAVEKYNLKPRAKIVAVSVVGSDPEVQLDGPIFVIPKVLEKAGLKLGDIDLFEINEAFASVVVATMKELKIDPNKVNVNGGAVALGHPLGSSGARLLVTLLNELERRKLQYGLAALCIGGGQAIATIIERV